MSALTVASRGMFSRHVTLDEAGIRRGKAFLAWDDVDHYRYDWQNWTRPGDFLLIGRTRSVIRVAPIFDHWQIAADRLLRELHPRLRADPYFDPFTVDGDELVHAVAGRLAFADILHVELASVGPNVLVVVHGRETREWAQVDIGDIANPWLWFDRLAERSIVVVTQLPLHLPPVLIKLADWSTIDRSLPRAIARKPR